MAQPGLRLRGQEVRVVVMQDGATIAEINSVASTDSNTDLVIQEDGFLGETANRYDTILNGFGGGFEMQLTTANWIKFADAAIAKAQRVSPGTIFNVVRIDLFSDGSSIVHTFSDVAWGPIPETVGGRAEFVKVKLTFKCSERATQVSSFV